MELFFRALKTLVYLIPYMSELYNNKEKYFEQEKFDLISTEAWQVYKDFSKLYDDFGIVIDR